MADQAIAAGDRLSVGQVLKRSYAILLGNLSSFFAVALVAALLSFIFSEVWLSYSAALFPDADDSYFSLGAIAVPTVTVDSVLIYIATGVIAYGTLRELQGRPAGFRDIVRRGLAIMGPLVLLGLVETLAILTGLALLVIPGLILIVWFWVSVPVAAIERRGVVASLARSRTLTEGNRGPIFVLMLVSLATFAGFGYGIAYVVDYETAFWRSLMSEVGGSGLLTAFWAIVSAVSYFDLKRIKEGTAVDDIAAVFD